MATAADRLAELLAEAETEDGLASRLPRQLVHGDFWDDNLLFRQGRPVLLADLGAWRDAFAQAPGRGRWWPDAPP